MNHQFHQGTWPVLTERWQRRKSCNWAFIGYGRDNKTVWALTIHPNQLPLPPPPRHESLLHLFLWRAHSLRLETAWTLDSAYLACMDNKYFLKCNKQEMPEVLISCISTVPFIDILSWVKRAKQGQDKDKENQSYVADEGLELR